MWRVNPQRYRCLRGRLLLLSYPSAVKLWGAMYKCGWKVISDLMLPFLGGAGYGFYMSASLIVFIPGMLWF